jgi:flagellar basal-body rod protein FlgG
MLRALYSSAAGMQSQQLNLDVISNNLANVNTTGFKKSKIEFQDLLYQTTRSAGAEAGAGNQLPTGLQVGHGSKPVATSKIFTNGELTQTGERLDVAIQGDGFFEVQMPDGTRAYTRDGALKTASDGRITTSDGLALQGGFQPIPSGTTAISISPTGEVTTTTHSGSQNFRVQLSLF